jgi:hypothetical protein
MNKVLMPTNEENRMQLAELIETLSLIISQARAYQGALPDYRIMITQMVEVKGVENERYHLQPMFTYDNEQGVLHPTEAQKTWAERMKQRIITG